MTIQANQGFGVSIFGATSAGGGGSTSPGGSSGQLQYNASGSFGGMAGTSWDDTNRSLTLTGATVTTSQPVLNLSQTWNAGAVTFTGLKFNATDTASAAASLLLDLQVGGTSVFNITKGGTLVLPNNSISGSTYYRINTSGIGFYRVGTYFGMGSSPVSPDAFITSPTTATWQLGAADAAAPVAQTLQVQSVVSGSPANTAGANFTIKGSAGNGNGAGGSIIFQVAPAGTAGVQTQNTYATALTIDSTRTVTAALAINANTFQNSGGQGICATSAQLGLFSTGLLGWTNNAGSAGALDTILARDAANTLALRNGTNAQTFNVYNTYTDASNYERAALTWSSNIAYLRAQNAGTGSARLLVPVTGSTTVASLPAAATAGAGARSFVTDANATTFLSTVAGGGANKVPVVSDGTNWLIG